MTANQRHHLRSIDGLTLRARREIQGREMNSQGILDSLTLRALREILGLQNLQNHDRKPTTPPQLH